MSKEGKWGYYLLVSCQRLEHTDVIQATQQFWELGPTQPMFADEETITGKDSKRLL